MQVYSIIPTYEEMASVADLRDLKYLVPNLYLHVISTFKAAGLDINLYDLDSAEIVEYDEESTTYRIELYTELPSEGFGEGKSLDQTLQIKLSQEDAPLYVDISSAISEDADYWDEP